MPPCDRLNPPDLKHTKRAVSGGSYWHEDHRLGHSGVTAMPQSGHGGTVESQLGLSQVMVGHSGVTAGSHLHDSQNLN